MMKNTLFILLLGCTFYTCSGETDNADESDSDIDTTVNKEEPIDTLNEEMVDENVDIMSTPGGKIIGEYFASSTIFNHFCEDGSFYRNEDNLTLTYGNWMLKGDTIIIDYSEKGSIVGVGDPLPPPPVVAGNYVPEYEDYDTLSEPFDGQDKWSWQEMKDYMEEDPAYPYEILEDTPICK